jgi:hypothetical protein
MAEEKDETSYHEYWSTVDLLVQEVKDNVREQTRRNRDIEGAITEAVDGNWWVIHAFAATQGLLHSTNEDALWEDDMGGSLEDCGSWSDVQCKLMLHAMMADVRDKLGGWDPDEDDEEEEEEEEDSDAEEGFVPEPDPDPFEMWVGYTNGRNEVDVEVINLLDARLYSIDRENLILWYHEARRRGSRELYSVRAVLARAERESFASWAIISEWAQHPAQQRVFPGSLGDLDFQHLTTRIVDALRRE